MVITEKKQLELSLYPPLTDLELGWLAGIIDGEGTIGMVIQSLDKDRLGKFSYVQKQTRPYQRRNYEDYQYPMIAPFISVTSTSFELLQKYTQLLTNMRLRYHYILSRHSDKNGNWNDSICVRISRVNSVHKMLTYIRNYLSEKKLRAELIMEFCEWKISLRTLWRAQHNTNRKPNGQLKKGRVFSEEEEKTQRVFWDRFLLLPAKKPNIRLSETRRLGSRPIEIKG